MTGTSFGVGAMIAAGLFLVALIVTAALLLWSVCGAGLAPGTGGSA